METMRIESSSENIAMSAQNSQKPKTFKPSKEPKVCSLGHPGHSDERCYTRIRREERDLANKYREMMKGKGETAQLTTIQPQSTTSAPIEILPVTPSYYDEAYAVGDQDLTVVTLDTACSSHMFGSRIFFKQLRPTAPSSIKVASKSGNILAHKKGLVAIGSLGLKEVIYSPELLANLISAGMLYDEGYDIRWNARSADVYAPDGTHLLTFHRNPRHSTLWQIQVSPPTSHKACSTLADSTANAELWHRRLGHLHPAGVILFLKSSGLSTPTIKEFPFCDACAMGKTTRSILTSPFH